MAFSNYCMQADVWSLAICLLELANGKPPNRKSPIRAMFYAATEGIKIPHEDKLSDEFKDFLAQCLQIDQTKRATPTELKKVCSSCPIKVLGPKPFFTG